MMQTLPSSFVDGSTTFPEVPLPGSVLSNVSSIHFFKQQFSSTGDHVNVSQAALKLCLIYHPYGVNVLYEIFLFLQESHIFYFITTLSKFQTEALLIFYRIP